MKEKIRTAFEAALAVLFLASSILGYYKDVSHMWEYCFISGIAVGAVFLVSVVRYLTKKKRLPVWAYLACAADVVLILIATLTMGLNLEGAFWFIHIINPALLLAYWLIFCDSSNLKRTRVTAALIFPLCYIIVSFVRLKLTGECAFPANAILNWNPQWLALPISAAVLAVILLVAFALYFLNRLFHKKHAVKKAD